MFADHFKIRFNVFTIHFGHFLGVGQGVGGFARVCHFFHLGVDAFDVGRNFLDQDDLFLGDAFEIFSEDLF